MNHRQTVEAIQFIRPKAEFTLVGNVLTWLDTNQSKPTEADIEAGWIAHKILQETKAESEAITKASLLERLGITAEEAKLLLS